MIEEILASWQILSWSSIGLIALSVVYFRGWLRVRRLANRRFSNAEVGCFFAGVATLFVALNSPLDAFSGFLLQAHMVQHLLLTMVAPPLLLQGKPYLPLLMGLPKWVTRDVLGPFLQWPLMHRMGAVLTHPLVALGLFLLSNVLWHLPPMYELALQSQSWHDIEHACFFWTAILFWWPVVQPWPSRPQWPRWAMIPYLVIADLQNTGLAGFMTFYDRVLYPTYAAVPRLGGIGVLEDQTTAGVLMWVPGAIFFLVPAGVIAATFLQGKKGIRPSAMQGGEEEKVARGERVSRGLIGSIVTRAFSITCSPLRFFTFSFPFLKWVLFGLAGVVVVDGLLGPQISPLNLAGILPWTHWRGFTVIALLLLGNLFCGACPFVLARDLGRKIIHPRWQWPKWLRNKWPAVILFVVFLFSYETFDLWDRPWATSLLILGYFGGILIVDLLFKQASFCKYICPIGQFHFFGSLVSPVEVKVRKADVCASCRTHDCLKGNEQQRGCELLLFQPKKSGNMDCTFCLDCVRACPSQNVELIGGVPGRDLWYTGHRSAVGDLGRRTDYAALFWVLVFGAYANALGMLIPVLELGDRVRAMLPFESKALWVLGLLVVVGGILPALLLFTAAGLSKIAGGLNQSIASTVKQFLPSLIPLGFCLWVAHFLFHFATGFVGPLTLIDRFGWDIGSLSHLVSLRSIDWLLSVELLIIDFGVVLSGYVAWRLVLQNVADARRRFAAFFPWALLLIVLFIAAVWIIFQPMQMRGVSGA